MKRTHVALTAFSLLGFSAWAACKPNNTDDKTTSPPAPVLDASTTTQAAVIVDAAPSAKQAATPEKPVYRSYRGRTFFFGTERRGDAVRAIYYSGGTTADLQGKAKDATHFSVRQTHVAKGEKPIEITGEWSPDGSTLTATLSDPHAKKKTPLTSSEGPFADKSRTKFKDVLKGSLGGRFIRMKLERDGDTLSGLYRYSKSAEDITLSGTVVDKDGTFDLTESVKGKVTGKFSGVFVSLSAMLATWSSPDGSRSFPVEMDQGDSYPETVDLGSGLSLYPQETMIEGNHCKTDIVFPQIRGAKDRAKETALNALLRGDQGSPKSCEGPGPDDPVGMDYEQSNGYSLLTEKRGRFVSLSQGGWSFTGGAHGNGASECSVVDTKTLTQFRMVDSLTKDGRDKLGDMVSKALQGPNGEKLTEQGYYNDALEIGKDTNVCLKDSEIQVEFTPYEVAPYFMGAPEATFPKADVRALFEKTDVMDGVFTQ